MKKLLFILPVVALSSSSCTVSIGPDGKPVVGINPFEIVTVIDRVGDREPPVIPDKP